MPDDYLWDKSGPPDPDVERLETLLAPLGHSGVAPELPATAAAPMRVAPRRPLVRRVLALAAALIAVSAIGLWRLQPTAGVRWRVEHLAGSPRVGARTVTDHARLAVGDLLETGVDGRVRVDIGAVGQLDVEPRTRLQLVRTRNEEHRLSLRQGTIHAVIWAPPGRFFVETPSATTVDLGCAYTLQVDSAGAGLVRVTSGWVAFESRGRESFIPQGATCATRPVVGPGTPSRIGASETLRAALEHLDFGRTTPEADGAALDRVLAEVGPDDAFTLWHVLQREEGDAKARAYDRMAALAPPPAGVTREAVLRGDRDAFDRWWDSLGLGEVALWRTYESTWRP